MTTSSECVDSREQECFVGCDINGDGKPDLACSSGRTRRSRRNNRRNRSWFSPASNQLRRKKLNRFTVPSVITSKPASRDRLKTGHFESFGDEVIYCAAGSFVKLAA